MNYKREQFMQMVNEAKLHLKGDCPLIEDEAIVWASERIQELERFILKLQARKWISQHD
jgi:hypothetical protein